MGVIQSRQHVLFREVRAAWDEADELRATSEVPLGSQEARTLCADVRGRLEPLHVPFLADPVFARDATCGRCRCIALCGFERNAVAVARFCACAAHMFGYKLPFTVVMAFGAEPGVRDLKSLTHDNAIICFRDDGDFFANLLRECVKLMTREADVVAEFGGILITCLSQTQTLVEYEELLREQQKRTSVFAPAVLRQRSCRMVGHHRE